MLLTVAVSLALAAYSPGCSRDEIDAGLCTVENNGTSVEIGGTRPGGSDSSAPRGGDGGGGGSGGDRENAPEAIAPAVPCADADLVCDRTENTFSVGVIRPTLNDVASFAPASLLLDEPAGVGVVGMPMNFVVSPTVHERTGELFDLPITVRFTPTSVEFVHGDGTSRTAPGGGSTWAQLGLPQFSATPTSHAYAARGTYAAVAIVRYSAEFNLGRGWAPIDGLLEIPTAATTIRVLEVRTALVDQTCLENPSGPGC